MGEGWGEVRDVDFKNYIPYLTLPSLQPLCPARAGHLSLSGEKNIEGSVCGEGKLHPPLIGESLLNFKHASA